MGALTSKPYAFKARPWELDSFVLPNWFEPFSSTVRFDLRGSEIMRVLPNIGPARNSEWISDSVRFSYDGFSRQRLVEHSSFQSIEPDEIEFFHEFDERYYPYYPSDHLRGYRTVALIGPTVSIDEIVYFESLLAKVNGTIFPGFYFNSDWRSSYLSKDIRNELSPVVIFINFDPSTQFPALNVNFINNSESKYYSIGPFTNNLNINVEHLSSNASILLDIVSGRHSICPIILKAGSVDVIFPLEDTIETIEVLIEFFKSTLVSQGVNVSINPLSTKPSTIAVFETTRSNFFQYNPYSTRHFLDHRDTKVISVYSDDFELTPHQDFVPDQRMYIGSHGDRFFDDMDDIHDLYNAFIERELDEEYEANLDPETFIEHYAFITVAAPSELERHWSYWDSAGFKHKVFPVLPIPDIRGIKSASQFLRRYARSIFVIMHVATELSYIQDFDVIVENGYIQHFGKAADAYIIDSRFDESHFSPDVLINDSNFDHNSINTNTYTPTTLSSFRRELSHGLYRGPISRSSRYISLGVNRFHLDKNNYYEIEKS